MSAAISIAFAGALKLVLQRKKFSQIPVEHRKRKIWQHCREILGKMQPIYTLRAKDASCCEGLTVTAYLASIHATFHSTLESQVDLTAATVHIRQSCHDIDFDVTET